MYNGLADLRGKSRLDFRQCYPSSFFLFFILCVVPCLWWFFLLFYYAHTCVSVLVDVAMFILSFYCCRMCVCVCACLCACACADVLYPQYSCVIFFNFYFFPLRFLLFLIFFFPFPSPFRFRYDMQLISLLLNACLLKTSAPFVTCREVYAHLLSTPRWKGN